MHINSNNSIELSEYDKDKISEAVFKDLIAQKGINFYRYEIVLDDADEVRTHNYECDLSVRIDILNTVIFSVHEELINGFASIESICKAWAGETDAMQAFIDKALTIKPRPTYLESLDSVFKCLVNACKLYDISE